MKIEITRPNGDLKREVWHFSMALDWTNSGKIYLDSYSFQTKETTRHRNWKVQTHWDRLMHRDNNIEKPPLPSDVEEEMRQVLADKIKGLPIIY